MKAFVSGGVVLAALLTAAPAIAGASSSASLTSQAQPARRNVFAANQNRSDVAAHVARMFKPLDLNHDGFLTRDEIAASQAQFNARTAKSTPKREARMFDRLDTNHDGQITEAEADAAREIRAKARGKQAKPAGRHSSPALFARADSNKDGIVTRAEFEAAAAAGKIKVRHASMRGSALVRLFDVADVNKDGRVSLEEAQQAALLHFDAADLNHDGVLSPDERRQAKKSARAKRGSA
jgi:Ca2+-binding EF-hand superfamily protein